MRGTGRMVRIIIIIVMIKKENPENSPKNSPEEVTIVVIVLMVIPPIMIFLFSGFFFKVIEFSGVSRLTNHQKETQNAYNYAYNKMLYMHMILHSDIPLLMLLHSEIRCHVII
jgi:hypothetical protein